MSSSDQTCFEWILVFQGLATGILGLGLGFKYCLLGKHSDLVMRLRGGLLRGEIGIR